MKESVINREDMVRIVVGDEEEGEEVRARGLHSERNRFRGNRRACK